MVCDSVLNFIILKSTYSCTAHVQYKCRRTKHAGNSLYWPGVYRLSREAIYPWNLYNLTSKLCFLQM